jgi:predicted translin family RNA/ssDNA-binding protein
MVNDMTLEEILSSIRTEIENDDDTRETILPLVRDAVRKFSQSIKASHRKHLMRLRIYLMRVGI